MPQHGDGFSHPIATDQPGWDFDYEALGQFGTFGSANIRAWTVASETGYRIPTLPLKPRFSAKADISSGDHPYSNPNTLGTFNPLFPKGDYFGVLATTGPGPINFVDLHPHVEAFFPGGKPEGGVNRLLGGSVRNRCQFAINRVYAQVPKPHECS
jgi:hypothetical protein